MSRKDCSPMLEIPLTPTRQIADSPTLDGANTATLPMGEEKDDDLASLWIDLGGEG